MRLSKIKTKEIRYVVWKYRLKRFLPHILTLCLAVIVAGGAFSAYSGFFRNYPLLLLYPIYLNFASSNCLPHLPYIVRFIIFNLLFVPSTNPLL